MSCNEQEGRHSLIWWREKRGVGGNLVIAFLVQLYLLPALTLKTRFCQQLRASKPRERILTHTHESPEVFFDFFLVLTIFSKTARRQVETLLGYAETPQLESEMISWRGSERRREITGARCC